jgi:hypothetical protein
MVRRVVVSALSLAGIVICVVLLVREAALATGDGVGWGAPSWYREMVGEGAWTGAGAAGVAVLALVVLCLVLAVLLVVPRRARPSTVLELGRPDARVGVPVSVLERLLTLVLANELRGTALVRQVRMARRQGRLAMRTCVSTAPTDLIALHARILSLARRDLGSATGLEVESLMLKVDRFVTPEEAKS